MDKAAKIRWTILSIALVLTIAAILYPVPDDASPKRHRVGRASHAMPMVAVLREQVDAAIAGPEEIFDPTEADPFVPRHWQAPAPVPVAEAIPLDTSPAPEPPFVGPERPSPPPPPPPLPFQFQGRMNDDNGAVVYLSHGEQMLVARKGETLESMYLVVSIAPGQVELRHLPTGAVQFLNLPVTDQ